MQSFLLPGLMAFGRTSCTEFPIKSKSVDDYLASTRKYQNIEIQPFIIQTEESIEHHWQLSPSDGYSILASFQGIYEIRLMKPEIGASDLIDALHGMMAILHCLSPENLFAIPMKEDSIPSSRIINLNDAGVLYQSMLPHASAQYDYESVFGNRWCRDFNFDEHLWRLVDQVIGDETLIYASLFLKATYEQYMFFGDEIESTILGHEEIPSRIIEAVDIENAIHNAYKIVEAIYGGTLTRNWRQVADNLSSKGIDTDELVGYINHGIFQREPVIEKIKRLKHARDDRAAHGRIHQNRRNTYYELMDYQELARHLLGRYIQNKYPQTIP